MPKKKFKDTNLGKILIGAVKVINPTLGNVIEGVVSPNDAIKEITKSDISIEDKIKLQQLMFEQQNKEVEETTKRWVSDNETDSFLTRNIRPLTLAFLTATLFIYIILDSSLEGFKIDSNWIDLLSSLLLLVYGGYFGMRSAEKITKNWKNGEK
ncbi:MAG: hypothetical protein Unbinned5434contig1000_29 [Prokaryotic dsDNA virus sp.]|jgi:hypothetical protein|nr:MAG: hypothetical protein Unbinned5434contig1000_29 [Prokaryotic dsDNA virus sp.]